jgi:hypothetical protein
MYSYLATFITFVSNIVYLVVAETQRFKASCPAPTLLFSQILDPALLPRVQGSNLIVPCDSSH